MKKVLCLISLIAMIFTLAACGASEPQAYDFDGNWYSTKDGYLYVFTDGGVFCEENYVTLDSGKKTSGGYYEYENYIEAYVIETIGAGADVAPLYLIQEQGSDMLCSDAEGKNIIFCRDAAIAQQIVEQKEKEREEEKKKQEEQAAEEEKNQILNAPTVTYDSIVAGNHTGEIIAIEAIISAYEYNDLLEMYEFDLWYWSDKENRYIQDEGCFIFVDDYSPEVLEPLKTFDDGDRIKMVLEVYADDSFGPSAYLWSELIEKGDLPDSGIPSNPESSNNSTGNAAGDSTADISDIAVRFETDYIDGDRLHITVFTKNNSEETFSGNVYVTFYSADGKDRLGSDTIIVDELLPGRESWADIIVDAYRGTPKMTVDFSEVSFIPVKEVTAEVDSDATEKTKNSYYWNFDGVSWYNDITDIVVYTDGTCVVTVKKETKENGQFYAATIWSCGNDYGVEEVQVVDPDGKILAVY